MIQTLVFSALSVYNSIIRFIGSVGKIAMDERKVRKIYDPLHSFPALFKNVGIYCRVSSGLREQLNSLSAQASGFVRWVAANNSMRLVDMYIDVTSGETPNRSEFARMLADAENGKLDVLITKSISRFGRNTEDALQAIRLLKKHKVQVIFDQEHIDTNKDDSEVIISILSAYAEADNHSRRENQIWGVKKRLKDGTSELYFRPCYGYRKNDEGVISICSDEAAVVQLIFASYLEGTSIIGIQRILQEQGIPTSRGKDIWSKRAIEKILTNEKYTGDVIARKTITSEAKGHKRIDNETEDRYMLSDVFPAIITKEMFTAVQTEMVSRSNIVVDETGRHRKDTHYSSKVGKALNIK